jgi:hypothetical protein
MDPWSYGSDVPDRGYQVPPGFGYPGYPGAGYDPANDPLVPPPDTFFDGWTNRVQSVLKRSWRTVVLILLVTLAAPQIVLQILEAAAGSTLALVPGTTGGRLVLGFGAATWIVIIVLTVGFSLVGALGWASAIWAVTQEAAGQQVTLTAALQGGLRRALPMWGWYLASSLLIGVGIILCILPGLYFATAVSLFSFVVMYERGTAAIGRSFRLVNKSFGAVLGRVALLAVIYVAVSLAIGCVFGLALGLGSGLTGGAVGSASSLVFGSISALVSVPLQTLLLVGLLVTYTQMRAKEEPLSTQHLWAAVNAV